MKGRAFKAILPILFLIPPLAVFSGLALVPAMVLLAIPCFAFQEKKSFRFSDIMPLSVLLAFAVFFVWAFITIPISDVPASSYMLWIKLVFLCVAGMICVRALSQTDAEQKHKLRQDMVYSGSLALFFLLWEIGTSGSLSTQLRGGESFTMDQLNRGACVLALIIWPFLNAVVRLLNRPAWMIRLTLLSLWVVGLGTLLHLESLSAIIAYGAATAAFLFVYLFGERLILFLIVAMLLPLLATPFLAQKATPDKTQEIISLPDSALHRLYIWQFTADKALKKQLLGYGFDASRNIPGGKEKVVHHGITIETWEKMPLHPHNSVLQIWLELGWVGVALYVLLASSIVYAISASFLEKSEKAVMMAVATAYITMSMTAYGVWQEWWIAAAFIAATYLAAVAGGGAPALERRIPKYQAFPDAFRR